MYIHTIFYLWKAFIVDFSRKKDANNQRAFILSYQLKNTNQRTRTSNKVQLRHATQNQSFQSGWPGYTLQTVAEVVSQGQMY